MEAKGQPIPGSRYYRDFCAQCRAPIRVPKDALRHGNCCSDCTGGGPPAPHTGLCKRQRSKLGKTTGG